MVPHEERDRPTPPWLRREVLSRDGYFCRIPGCRNLAIRGHHLEFRSQGGRTTAEGLAGLCKEHHDLVHQGSLLLSGTGLLSGRGDGLLVSDMNHRPIIRTAGAVPRGNGPRGNGSPAVTLEVEPKPAAPAGAGDEALTLPSEVTSAWWLARRRSFEWSERRKVFIYHPEEAEPEAAAPPHGGCGPAASPRPPGGAFERFVGQKRAVQSLAIALGAAKLRGETPPPVLLSGPPGLGKTTLARLAAEELGTRLHATAGPALADPGALVGVLASLGKGDALLIDEIHALPALVAEWFYQALDEGTVPITVVAGSGTRLLKLRLEPFFLIGATTEESRLPRPFHSRFALKERLEFYGEEELEEIARRRAGAIAVEVAAGAARALARGSRGSPRELLLNLRRARDCAQVERGAAGGAAITAEIAERALSIEGIDGNGLSAMDRKVLGLLHEKGRPVGLRALSDILGESPRTVLEVHEPYLVREGYLARTHRGRALTRKGRRLLERL